MLSHIWRRRCASLQHNSSSLWSHIFPSFLYCARPYCDFIDTVIDMWMQITKLQCCFFLHHLQHTTSPGPAEKVNRCVFKKSAENSTSHIPQYKCSSPTQLKCASPCQSRVNVCLCKPGTCWNSKFPYDCHSMFLWIFCFMLCQSRAYVLVRFRHKNTHFSGFQYLIWSTQPPLEMFRPLDKNIWILLQRIWLEIVLMSP